MAVWNVQSPILYILSIQEFVILSIQNILGRGIPKSRRGCQRTEPWRLGARRGQRHKSLGPWIKLYWPEKGAARRFDGEENICDGSGPKWEVAKHAAPQLE